MMITADANVTLQPVAARAYVSPEPVRFTPSIVGKPWWNDSTPFVLLTYNYPVGNSHAPPVMAA